MPLISPHSSLSSSAFSSFNFLFVVCFPMHMEIETTSSDETLDTECYNVDLSKCVSLLTGSPSLLNVTYFRQICQTNPTADLWQEK